MVKEEIKNTSVIKYPYYSLLKIVEKETASSIIFNW